MRINSNIVFKKMQKKNSYIIPSHAYMSNSSFLIKQNSPMHSRIHASMNALSSKFKKKIIACHTSMIHNLCICITPPTFLRFMKK